MVRPRASSVNSGSDSYNNSTSGLTTSGSQTEIVPLRSSQTDLTSREAAALRPKPAQFYTDKYFSHQFLSNSIPLSQMIVYRK